MKYRKKPVVVEAYQTDKEMDIETLEGTMHASVGDYIITGVRGEQYPCKPDIFEQTYEPADAPTASPWHRVEEPPKEDGKYVAINVKTKWWYEASYENGNWKAVDLFGQRWVVIHPTHWMPVELPREE